MGRFFDMGVLVPANLCMVERPREECTPGWEWAPIHTD